MIGIIISIFNLAKPDPWNTISRKNLHILKISFIDIMAELQEKVSQYIGFKPNEIHPPITKEDRQEFCKIIADQEKMTDIVMHDYRFLLQNGHNGKGGDRIHIGWLLAYTVSQAEKVLINPPENFPEKILVRI